MSTLRTFSQICRVLWVLGSEYRWFSKLDVLGAHLSSVCLKSWDASCWVSTSHFPGGSSSFWVPSSSWVIAFDVGYMVRIYPSFTCFDDVFCLSNMWLSRDQILGYFEKIVPFVTIDSSVGGDEFRIFLHCQLERAQNTIFKYYIWQFTGIF